jgi:hypothetical protein
MLGFTKRSSWVEELEAAKLEVLCTWTKFHYRGCGAKDPASS